MDIGEYLGCHHDQNMNAECNCICEYLEFYKNFNFDIAKKNPQNYASLRLKIKSIKLSMYKFQI